MFMIRDTELRQWRGRLDGSMCFSQIGQRVINISPEVKLFVLHQLQQIVLEMKEG
jgi:hypothetical protein